MPSRTWNHALVVIDSSTSPKHGGDDDNWKRFQRTALCGTRSSWRACATKASNDIPRSGLFIYLARMKAFNHPRLAQSTACHEHMDAFASQCTVQCLGSSNRCPSEQQDPLPSTMQFLYYKIRQLIWARVVSCVLCIHCGYSIGHLRTRRLYFRRFSYGFASG